MPRQTRCIDCNEAGIVTDRSATNPGPRCLEHWRLRKKETSKANHAKRIEENFDGLTAEMYWALYEFQGRKCYVCQVATGKRKRLAVEHEHNKPGCDHPPEQGCLKCIRGLACGPCNQGVLIHPVPALRRAIEMLEDPPAQRFLETYF